MTPGELDLKLREITEHESKYKEGWENPEIATWGESASINGQEIYRYTKLPVSPLTVVQHSRFHETEEHVHDWVELVYTYNGESRQRINGELIVMHKGQCMILEQNVRHQTGVLSEEDIVVTIMVAKEYLTASFFNRISHQNLISKFFVDAMTSDLAHNHYVFFHSEKSRRLSLFMQEFLCEYYDPSEYMNDTLNSLFILILTELIQMQSSDNFNEESGENPYVLPALKYIEQNYQNLTLKETARHFGLNPNYLSNMLKARTGQSFQELLLNQRMMTAARLLLTTSMPVDEVAHSVGYSNTTFFYKKFSAHFGTLPKEYRKNR